MYRHKRRISYNKKIHSALTKLSISNFDLINAVPHLGICPGFPPPIIKHRNVRVGLETQNIRNVAGGILLDEAAVIPSEKQLTLTFRIFYYF